MTIFFFRRSHSYYLKKQEFRKLRPLLWPGNSLPRSAGGPLRFSRPLKVLNDFRHY